MKRLWCALPVLAAVLAAAGARSAEAAETSGNGVRFVYLIRHGDYTREATKDDVTANGLNAVGRAQAELVAKRLESLHVPIRSLVSSDFTRARETADVIGQLLRLKPERDPLLHECVPRDAEPRPGAGPEPSDVTECEAHLAEAYAKYLRPSSDRDARDVLVCHGNVIRWMVRRALGVGTPGWRAMDVANASLTVIAVRPDGTTMLVALNDVGHLPPAQQTWVGPGPGWVPPPR